MIATERAADSTSAKLNKLRAGVLGANDGIVSVAATVIGVAAATQNVSIIATAGVAALAAGAFSMATGEYISVSTQLDTERAIINRVTVQVAERPDELVAVIADGLVERGISQSLAGQAAAEMACHDPVGAVSRLEGIDPEDLINPRHAAWASFFSFIVGAAIPVAAILLFPPAIRIPATFGSVLLALALTGVVSSHLGDADAQRPVIRTMIGGTLGMIATYGIGSLLNVQV